MFVVKAFAHLLLVSQAHCFAVSRSVSIGEMASLQMSASNINTDVNPNEADNKKEITNPSTAFGSPISVKMMDFNKDFVGKLKQIVFDNYFEGEGRDFARFYALETIARVPYFR